MYINNESTVKNPVSRSQKPISSNPAVLSPTSEMLSQKNHPRKSQLQRFHSRESMCISPPLLIPINVRVPRLRFGPRPRLRSESLSNDPIRKDLNSCYLIPGYSKSILELRMLDYPIPSISFPRGSTNTLSLHSISTIQCPSPCLSRSTRATSALAI